MIVDPNGVHEERIDGEVDHEPNTAHEPEPDQLQPVGGPPHTVKQARVRPDLHGGGLLAHPPRVATWPGGCSR